MYASIKSLIKFNISKKKYTHSLFLFYMEIKQHKKRNKQKNGRKLKNNSLRGKDESKGIFL